MVAAIVQRVDAGAVESLIARAAAIEESLTAIGYVANGAGVACTDSDGHELSVPAAGYQHFPA